MSGAQNIGGDGWFIHAVNCRTVDRYCQHPCTMIHPHNKKGQGICPDLFAIVALLSFLATNGGKNLKWNIGVAGITAVTTIDNMVECAVKRFDRVCAIATVHPIGI